MLFRALTGRAPFSAPDDAGVLTAHLTDPPPRVSDVAPGVPRGFDEVVRRALAKRPDDRYATAGELGRAALAVRYDVYLCHAPGDAPAAEAIAATLDAEGLEPWLAARCAVPGGEASREALEGLRAAGACAVLVGPGGLGDWARDELAAAREIAARERGLPAGGRAPAGAPEPFDPSLAILAAAPWVDLRAGLGDPDGLRDLDPGGAGRAAARTAPRPSRRRRLPVPGPGALRRGPVRALLRPGGGDRQRRRAAARRPVPGRARPLGQRQELAAAGRRGPRPAPGGAAGQRGLGRRDLLARRPAARGPGRPGTGARRDPPQRGRAHGERAGARSGRPAGCWPGTRRRPGSCCWWTSSRRCSRSAPTMPSGRRSCATCATRPRSRPVGWCCSCPLRADFYQRCAEDPELRTLVSAQQILLGPLDAEGLRRADRGARAPGRTGARAGPRAAHPRRRGRAPGRAAAARVPAPRALAPAARADAHARGLRGVGRRGGRAGQARERRLRRTRRGRPADRPARAAAPDPARRGHRGHAPSCQRRRTGLRAGGGRGGARRHRGAGRGPPAERRPRRGDRRDRRRDHPRGTAPRVARAPSLDQRRARAPAAGAAAHRRGAGVGAGGPRRGPPLPRRAAGRLAGARPHRV